MRSPWMTCCNRPTSSCTSISTAHRLRRSRPAGRSLGAAGHRHGSQGGPTHGVRSRMLTEVFMTCPALRSRPFARVSLGAPTQRRRPVGRSSCRRRLAERHWHVAVGEDPTARLATRVLCLTRTAAPCFLVGRSSELLARRSCQARSCWQRAS